MKNLMQVNPDYFKQSEARCQWCFKHHFLPVYNFACQPNSKYIVYPDTQFFMTACWNDEAKKRVDQGEEVNRVAENLMPTAFVYESDTLPLKEQVANIKDGATKNILSITYSGNKSFHIIVPIHLTDSYSIGSDRELYKYLWKKVAKRLFKETAVLDHQCASIGRLSRMPGALRLKSIHGKYLDTENKEGCKEQKCLYLNEDAKPIDLREWIESFNLKSLGVSIQNTLVQSRQAKVAERYQGQDDDDLTHLINSNRKFPTPCKNTAIEVLVNDNIPSSDLLPDDGSYISTIWFLRNKFPTLTEEFVRKVKQAHPSCLPRRVEDYL